MKRMFGFILFIFTFLICFSQLTHAQDFSISSGEAVQGMLRSSDSENVYKFSTNADGEVYITLENTTGDFYIELYDQNNNSISSDYSSSKGDSLVIHEKVKKGSYYVKVEPYRWSGISSASYRLKATYAASIKRDPVTFEPNDTFETSLPIASGEFYESKSESGIDQDVYQFSTNKDGEVYIVLDKTTAGYYMELYDQFGNYIVRDYDSSKGSQLVINQHVQKGKYFIRIIPKDWYGITSGSYRLKATYPGKTNRNSKDFESNDTFETAFPVRSGNYYSSNSFASTDRDVYSFTTSRDGKATVTLDRTTGGFEMELYDANQNYIKGDYYSSSGNTIKLEESLAKGTYYIRIIPHGWSGITSAKYRLKASYLDKRPTVKAVSDKSTVITGIAESNIKVYAWVGKKKLGETKAVKGKYSIKIPKQKAGVTIALYTVDAKGNKSASTTVKVLDKTPPGIPVVNKVTSKSVYVTGKAEKNAKVYIYNKKKKVGEGTVNSKGHYKVKIKAQKKSSTLSVYAKDKAGNKSKTRSVKVN